MTEKWQQFEGLNNLQGFNKTIGEIFLRNELGNISTGYEVSHAGTSGSGYSFGGHQLDLANNLHARAVLLDILINSNSVISGEAFYGAIQARIEIPGTQSLTTEEKILINTALSSDYGKNKLNQEFVLAVEESVTKYKNIISSIPLTQSNVRATLLMSEEFEAYFADFNNQFGGSYNELIRYLSGESITGQYGSARLSGDSFTLEDFKNYVHIKSGYREIPAVIDGRHTTVAQLVDRDHLTKVVVRTNSSGNIIIEIEDSSGNSADTTVQTKLAQIMDSNGIMIDALFVKVTANGNETTYVLTKGDTSSKFFKANFSGSDDMDFSRVRDVYSDGHGKTYINASDQIGISNGAGGQVMVAAGKLVEMVEHGAEGLAKFTYNFVKSTVENSLGNFVNQSPVIVAQIVAGLIEGKDIDDILRPIAGQMVAAGAMDALVAELTKDGSFASLAQFKNNNVMAFDAIKGALAAVVVTAILDGKEAGFEDYAKAAANASVQRLITYGITNSGYDALTETVGGKATLTPVGAGAVAAVTTLAAALISGNGINADTIRAAAISGTIAMTSSAVTTAILGTSASAGPVGIAVGIVISAVLGTAAGNIIGKLGGGADRYYHNETIGSVVQGDTIIGVREQGGTLLVTNGAVVNAYGTHNYDVIVGGEESNILLGEDGDDMVDGRGGDDYLKGGTGQDHIEGGSGNDYIEGNDGHDRILAGDGNDSVLAGSGDDIVSGGAGNDSIEGEAGDDTLYGDSGNDLILGGSGNDVASGGVGDDLISGDNGDDVLDGSIGNDEIHGGNGNDILFGSEGNDTIHGDSGNDIVYGDGGIDILYGDLGDDIIDGGAGNDLLYGGIGNDILFGQDGDDMLLGEIGNDYLVGGKGNDELDGGDGNDVYTFGRGDGKDVVFDSGGASDIIRLANYTLEEITFVKDGNNLVLKAAPDGSDQVTIIDQISDQPIEYLMFSDGRVIDLATFSFGGNGSASYSLLNNTAQLTNLVTQATYPGTWQEAEDDRFYMGYNTSSTWYTENFDTSVMTTQAEHNIYNDVQVRVNIDKHKGLLGSSNTYHYYDYFETRLNGTSENDRILGAFFAETINGLAGNDQLYGNGGNDIVDGGADHDIIFGGSENDSISGKDGNDKIYGGAGNDSANGDIGNDTIYGDWGVDTLRGGDGDDFISGGADNDNIYGDAGNDIAYGDVGDDTIYGGSGSDFIVGGDGADRMYGESGDDYLEGGADADYLDGGDGNDILRGEGEGDQLIGGSGNDLLVGGKGSDSIDGGAGIDTAYYGESDSGVIVAVNGAASGGYATGDILSNIENITGSDYDDILTGDNNNNILIGGYGNDKLYGGSGDDTLEGGAGADYLDGGAGFDSVSYADSNSGVEINLIIGRGRFGYAEGDIFVSMEHVIGSKYDDRFIINTVGNLTFEGGGGNDIVAVPGKISDYTLVIDDTTIIAQHKTSGVKYVLPDVETINFDDGSLTPDDFPYAQNSNVMALRNYPLSGVVERESGTIIALKDATQNGTMIFNNDSTYAYTPVNSAATGSISTTSDHFSYTLTNSAGLQRLVTHTFNNLNHNSITASLNTPPQLPAIQVPQFSIITGSSTQLTANAAATGNQKNLEMAKLANGNYVVVWEESKNAGSAYEQSIGQTNFTAIYAQIFNSSGGKVGAQLEVSAPAAPVAGNVGSQYAPSVTYLSGGGFVVAWSKINGDQWTNNGADIKVQVYDSSGNKGSAFTANSSITAGNQANPSLASLNNNQFMLLWEDTYNSTTVYERGNVFNNNGTKVYTSSDFVFSTGTTVKDIATTNIISSSGPSRAIFVARNGSTIVGIVDPAAQNYTGGNFTIYSGTGIAADGISDIQVAALSATNFVVTWRVSSNVEKGLYARVYNYIPGSSTTGGAVIQLSNINNTALQSSVTGLGNGTFVVVYQTVSGSIKNLYGQVYRSDGSKVGEEFSVNNIDGKSASKPVVTSLGNGKFSVSWETLSGTDYDVVTRTFQADLDSINQVTHVVGNNFIGNIFADTITGTANADIISGNLGNDNINGGSGNDSITAGGGNDTVLGGLGADLIYGDAGDDNLSGGDGNDTISGGDGIDTINGDAGDDLITGGLGNDIAYGGNDNDTIYGEDGDDALYGDAGNDSISGGTGNDTIRGGIGNDSIYGNDGNDTIYGEDGDDIISGGIGSDTIRGGAGNDTINGDDGDDIIFGEDGNDILFGGAGNDTIDGGIGNDIIYGGDGVDNLTGSDGDDVIAGDAGNDTLYGNAGNDTLYGNVGDDNVSGGEGNDNIYGGIANDTLNGEGGDDALYGEDGNDTISGGSGADIIVGCAGDDAVAGNDGNDTIYATSGNDTLDGGAGSDSAIFSGNFSEYAINFSGSSITVADNNISNGNDGTDIISNIETISFADRSFIFENVSAQLQPNSTATGVLSTMAGSTSSLYKNSQHGNVIFNQDGTYTYTPTAGYSGSDSFHYIETEADGINKLITVAIGISNNNSNTTLYGTSGNNILQTGSGNDILNDSLGSDVFGTGAGTDIVIINKNAGTNDIITDFEIDRDKIDLSAFNGLFTSVGDLRDNMLQINSDVIINLSNSQTLTLKNINVTSLSRNEFIGDFTNGNTAPIALLANANVDQSQSVIIDVASSGRDADGDLLTIANITQGEHGTAIIQNGKIVYTTSSNYNGNDQLVYTLSDGYGATVSHGLNISISASNHDPVVENSIADQVINEDEPFSFTIPANSFVDIDGDTLAYTAKLADDSNLPAWLAFNTSTLTFSGIPDNNAVGDISVKVIANDGNVGIAESLFSIKVINTNDEPTANNITANINEDNQYIISAASLLIQSGAVDIEGNILTISSVQGATNGTVALNAGSVTFTPTVNYNGAASFTFTVNDGNGGIVIKTANLTVAAVNDTPTANNVTASINEDNQYTISAANLLLQAGSNDIDGDVLTISSVQAAANGTVILDGTNIIFTPAANYNGTSSFTYTISDGNGGTVTKTANITVDSVNDIPVATITTASGNEDNAITIDVLAGSSDIDGDTLSISEITQGQHGTAIIQDGKIIYTPGTNWNGTDQINYTIQDGHGGTVVKTLGITVNAVNDALILATNIADQNILAGNNFNLDLGQGHFTDVDGDNLTYTITKQDGSNAPSWMNFNPVTMTLSGTAPFGTAGILALMITASDGHASVTEAFDVNIASNVIINILSDNSNVIGTDNNDELFGSIGGSNLLNGGAGDDVLHYSGDDTWSGGFVAWNVGSPDAIINGEQVVVNPRFRSFDGFHGGDGYDKLIMGDDGDGIFLDDAYSANPFGANTARLRSVEEIDTGGGNDIVDLTSMQFSYGDVKVLGGAGNDVLWTSAGNDNIDGGTGNDNIDGGTGNDILKGGEGNDTILGRGGNDVINGGAGADTLTGGDGADSFDYSFLSDSNFTAYDTISDFQQGVDHINLHDLALAGIISFDDLSITNDTVNNETIITANDNSAMEHFELHLKGIIDLHQQDFIWS